jgi:hypothetical protein
MQLELSQLKRYLEERSEGRAEIRKVRQLGDDAAGSATLKQFGYGHPFLVAYKVISWIKLIWWVCIREADNVKLRSRAQKAAAETCMISHKRRR